MKAIIRNQELDYTTPIKDGDIYISTGINHTRKTYLRQDGKDIDLSNRHLRRAWMKQQAKVNDQA